MPITLLSAVPLWLAGRANSDEMYSFSFGDAPYDRGRSHIENVVLRRESAPEVRAFGLASYLAERWSQLYDDRITEIARLVRRFVRRAAFGAAASSAVLSGCSRWCCCWCATAS